jgi:hypothetical protein
MITKLLFNHTSPETAYLVDDYPYGFRLRCKIRYWLEYKKNKGFRLVSQTTNPKFRFSRTDEAGVSGRIPIEIWNKPKASTYARFGAAMYLNEDNHVTWAGLTEYAGLKETLSWLETYGGAVPEVGRETLKIVFAKRLAYEGAKQRGEISITCGEEKTICEPELSPEDFFKVREKPLEYFNNLIAGR